MKSFSKFFCAAALFTAVLVPAAKADTMTFAGNTKGCFGTGCVATNSATLSTLTFNTSSFNDQTSSTGFVSIGNNATGTDNFGSFTLGTGNASYSGNPFTLMVTFTAPTGISGGQASSFSALVFGSVTSTSGGGAQISFSPASQSYTFSNGTQSGSFTLNLNNVAVGAGSTANITGYITSAATSATPEPSSLMLLGTGLVSTAGMLMRRRRNLVA